MNERIRELAEQAKEETDPLYAKLYPQEFKDAYDLKFAQLIVRECAQVAEDVDGDSRARKCVLEHFGVEE